jgi:hypothetical protein
MRASNAFKFTTATYFIGIPKLNDWANNKHYFFFLKPTLHSNFLETKIVTIQQWHIGFILTKWTHKTIKNYVIMD